MVVRGISNEIAIKVARVGRGANEPSPVACATHAPAIGTVGYEEAAHVR